MTHDDCYRNRIKPSLLLPGKRERDCEGEKMKEKFAWRKVRKEKKKWKKTERRKTWRNGY